MKFDLHTHHERCGHADGAIERYIDSALKHGLQVIGISDHSPYFADKADQPLPRIAMAKSDFESYVKQVLELKERYHGRIEVLLGVESDFFPEHAALYSQQYAKYPFDYVIGSVHRVNDISIFNKRRWNGMKEQQKIRVKETYYDLIQQSARSGMFQILGHIDAMKGYYPAFSEIPTPKVEETLKVIAEQGVAIEINTSGKMKDVGGWYPADEILEQAQHYGVEVSFGSDAHSPDRVGDDWELVQRRLKEIGFDHWVFFRQKEKQIIPL